MTLLTQIKAAQLAARKQRDTSTIAALTTLIGDIELIGKNAGRETTDLEAVAVIKKFIKNVEETIKVADPTVIIELEAERDVYAHFLPKQLSREELTTELKSILVELNVALPKGKGPIMKTLKERFEGRYDGAMAAQIVSELV